MHLNVLPLKRKTEHIPMNTVQLSDDGLIFMRDSNLTQNHKSKPAKHLHLRKPYPNHNLFHDNQEVTILICLVVFGGTAKDLFSLDFAWENANEDQQCACPVARPVTYARRAWHVRLRIDE